MNKGEEISLNNKTADENGKNCKTKMIYKSFVYPRVDENLYNDDRVLLNFLKSEERFIISPNYFTCVQTEIEEHMRRTLTDWMMDVADEERCDCEVFPLAVNFLDRFLSIEAVHKSQLQVLGCACLFLASKVKQPQPLCARRLVEFSADSVNLSELMSWELLVLNRLKWDLGMVTACDFIDHILHKLQLPVSVEKRLRPHLQFFVSLISTEFNLAVLPPSVVAVSCLCVAFGRLLNDVGACGRMLIALRPIFKMEMYAYEPYVESIYDFIESVAAGRRTPVDICHLSVTTAKFQRSTLSSGSSPLTAVTPTDIRDVREFYE